MKTDYIWIRSLFKIQQYVFKHIELPNQKPGKNKRIHPHWFHSEFTRLKMHNPGGRELSDLQGLSETDIDNLMNGVLAPDASKGFKEVFNNADHYENLAKNCVEKNFLKLFDYKLDFEMVDHKSIPKISPDGDLVFIKEPVRRKRPITDDRIPTDEWSETFIASYLLTVDSPTVGLVELAWAKNEEERWLTHATLYQSVQGNNFNDIKFEAINKIEYVKNDSGHLLYIQVEWQTVYYGTEKKVIFQCVLEYPDANFDIIYGTFSSLYSLNFMSPSAGCVLLIKGDENDFGILKEYLRLPKGEANKKYPSSNPIIKKFLASQYFLTDKLFVKTKPAYKVEELQSYIYWDRVANIHSGTYTGSFMVKSDNIFEKETFAMEVYPSGQSELFLSNQKKDSVYTGVIRIFQDILTFKFNYKPSSNSYAFEFTINFKKDESKQFGVFHGMTITSYSGESFQTGIISYEKTNLSLQDAQKLAKSELISADNNSLANNLADYEVFLKDTKKRFPDQLILERIIKSKNPVLINNHALLSKLNLPTHLKYLTFRIPDSEEYDGFENTTFRIEKCDLKFINNYKEVEIISPSASYHGKVYYNGKVLLMILNPHLELNQTDSYFTIQIDLPSKTGSSMASTGPLVLFGTSTWKSEKYLEAKMVVLVEAAKIKNSDGSYTEDHLADVFSIGTHGERFDVGLERMLKEDNLYKGAYTYLCGRLNRHIHIFSGSGRREVFRPRDVTSREPYILAGLYIAESINESMPTEEANTLISKAKKYLFEGYLHQYGSVYHAGEVLNKEFIQNLSQTYNYEKNVKHRLEKLLQEQETLKSNFSKVSNDTLKKFMIRLWPYLNPSITQTEVFDTINDNH